MALTPETRNSQSVVRSLIQFPTEYIRTSQATGRAVAEADNVLRTTQARVRAVVKGRVDDPRVRAWTFTLDGHDFYVLRLGNIETLVYDVASGEWSVWGSSDSALWRAYDGVNWIGGRRLGSEFGSDVVVSDDGNGALYFLAPELTTDDDAFSGADVPRPFRRQFTAQAILESGYDFVACYGAQLFGSNGSDAGDVTLAVSDDRGSTYEDVSTLTIEEGELQFRLSWPSLGSMRAPGRLFRVTDYGALQRIDGMQMETGEDGA